jgi:hypothetical protein
LDITEKSRIENTGDSLSTEELCIVYAVCHVMGMLSACANPVIYGFLNENFQREFKDIYQKSKIFLLKCCSRKNNNRMDESTMKAAKKDVQQHIELAPLV